MKGAPTTPRIAEALGAIIKRIWWPSTLERQRIIVCPSIYSDDPQLPRIFGAAPPTCPPIWRTVAAAAGPGWFDIYWTGEEVCSREFSPGHLARVAERMGRKPILWDNYPVNDGPRMSPYLYIRAFTGRPAAIGAHLSGHAVNPALQPTLSRIPMLTLAESYEAGEAYEYAKAWDRAAEAVTSPEIAAVLRRHFRIFHDQGLAPPTNRRRVSASAERPLRDHPAAKEVLAWLDGHRDRPPAWRRAAPAGPGACGSRR